MELYPAIDLRDGRCVRLYQGDYDRETVYGDDPAAQAAQFESAGARWVHMVDLDAARSGRGHNRSAIAAAAAAVDANIQAGGGVRSDADADELFGAGVARVVIGTRAIEDPDWVATVARRGGVAVGLDARGRELAVNGWTEGSGVDLLSLAKRFEDAGVAALVVTEIGRDGTLAGPDVDQLGAVLDATHLDVIASGGVGTIDHLRQLVSLRRGDRQLSGVIVGRALYEGAFGVAEALDAVNAR